MQQNLFESAHPLFPRLDAFAARFLFSMGEKQGGGARAVVTRAGLAPYAPPRQHERAGPEQCKCQEKAQRTRMAAPNNFANSPR